MRRPDYSLCNQTVTVYNRYTAATGNTVKKVLVPRAFFDFKGNYNRDKQGLNVSNSFLLVIPELPANPGFAFDDSPDSPGTYTLKQGTKVMLGDGPDITDEQWREYIPAKYRNLVIVKTVDPKYYNGVITHVEAGG